MQTPIRIFTPGYKLTFDGTALVWTLGPYESGSGGFQNYTLVGQSNLYNNATKPFIFVRGFQTYDLSGLLRQDKTLNPLSYIVSNFRPHFANTQGDWITTPPQTPNPLSVSIENILSTSTVPQPATFGEQTDWSVDIGPDYENLLGQYLEEYVTDSTFAPGVIRQTSSYSIGTLSQTALQKLYFAQSTYIRINTPGTLANNQDTIFIAPQVITIAQEVFEEGTTQYVMRLAQTYDDLTAP